VLVRNNAPVFGANANPYSQPGDWQLSFASRNLVSNDHYNGKAEQHERQVRANYITNKQNLFDVGLTRTFTKRVSVSLGVPFVASAWAFRSPESPLPGPRVEEPQWGRGLGDISVTARSWVFDPDTHLDWNVSAGGGLKLPTGNEGTKDEFLNMQGALAGLQGNPVPNFVPRREAQYVDQSVQPGDGGWGLIMDTQAFWRVKRALLFASGSYLANPQDANDTPSILVILGVPAPDGLHVNSIPDQYVARAGASVHLWKGFSASLAWRVEGLKRYDLFGDNHGWRRPGTEMFWEPGFAYSKNGHTLTFNVPIGYYYNRHRNPVPDRPGDATFPRHIFLTSYSFKLGGSTAPAPVTAPAPAPAHDAQPAPAEAPKKGGGETDSSLVCPPVLFSTR
jgi:hypothetical protein